MQDYLLQLEIGIRCFDRQVQTAALWYQNLLLWVSLRLDDGHFRRQIANHLDAIHRRIAVRLPLRIDVLQLIVLVLGLSFLEVQRKLDLGFAASSRIGRSSLPSRSKSTLAFLMS